MTKTDLKGLEQHSEHLLAIGINSGDFALDPITFKQLVREIAIGICVHKVAPSVYFEAVKEGLSPILPPAYRYTMVGDLLTELSYITQGYIYGGFFDPKTNQLISFGHFFYEHYPEVEYHSFADYLAGDLKRNRDEAPQQESDYNSVKFSGIRPEFTLAFENPQVNILDHTITLSSLLTFNYTIHKNAHYTHYYESYVKKHGKEPDDYKQLTALCNNFQNKLTQNLPLYAKELMGKLQVIQGLVTYFQGIKEINKLPNLDPIEIDARHGLPETLPHLYASKYSIVMGVGSLLFLVINMPVEMRQTFFTDTPVSDELQEQINRHIFTAFDNQLQSHALLNRALFEPALVAGFEVMFSRVKKHIKRLNQTRDALLAELLESFNQQKLFPSTPLGISGGHGEAIKQVINNYIETHIIAYLERQIDPNSIEHIEKTQTFKSHWAQQLINYVASDKETCDTFLADKTYVFHFNEMCAVNMPYQAAHNTISFPTQSIKTNPELMQSTHHQEQWLVQLAIDQQHQAIETPAVIETDNKSYLTCRLAVHSAYVNEENYYTVLYDALRKINVTLFTIEDLQQLKVYFQDPTTELTIDENKVNKADQTILHYAAMHLLTPEAMQFLIAKYPQGLNQHDTFGYYPIHSAVSSGQLLWAQSFLKHDPTQSTLRTKEGYTPLMLAAMKGHVAIVTFLLEQEVDPNASLLNGITALTLAINAQQLETALLLIEHPQTNIDKPTENGNTPLLIALQMKLDSIAQRLMEKGADISHHRQFDGCDGMAVLVCYGGNADLLFWILKTFKTKRDERIVLYMTALEQYKERKAYLEYAEEVKSSRLPNAMMGFAGLALNAYLGGLTGYRLNAASIAMAAFSAYGLIDELCKKDKQDHSIDECWEAIHELTRALEELKQPMTYNTRDGYTCLIHVAAIRGYFELVQCLVHFESGNASVRNAMGENALMLAIKHGHASIALFLVDKTPINVVNDKQETASLMAIRGRQERILDGLLERGEDPSICDTRAESVLHYINKQHDTLRFERLNEAHQEKIIHEINTSHVHPMIGPVRNKPFANIPPETPLAQGPLVMAIMSDDIDFLRPYFQVRTPDLEAISLAIKHRSFACLSAWVSHIDALMWPELMQAAIESRCAEIITLLLEQAFDRNIAVDMHGNTIAHLLVQQGLYHLIQPFAKSGVDFTLSNAHGLMPIDYAIANDHQPCLEILLVLLNKQNLREENYLQRALNHERSTACQNHLLQDYAKLSPEKQEDVFKQACKHENIDLMETCLRQGNLSDHCKLTQLIWILNEPNLIQRQSMIDVLLNWHTDPTAQTSLGSPLDYAVKHARLLAIQAFHRAGFTNHITLYRHPVSPENPYVREALLNRDTQFQAEKSRLMQAHEQRNAATIEAILREGLPIEEVFLGANHAPFLHLVMQVPTDKAHYVSYIEHMLSMLAAQQANPFLVDTQGKTLFRICLSHGDDQSLQQKILWIKRYFDAASQAIFTQEMPKHQSALDGVDEDKCIFLIENGFPTKNRYQHSLLFFAVFRNYHRLVGVLLNHGEVIDSVAENFTPLRLAALLGHLELVKTMVEVYKANTNLKNVEQENALHIALDKKQADVALYLIEKTNHLSDRTNRGFSAFMLAACSGLLVACHALVDFVDDLNHTDENGFTCLHHAVAQGHVEVVTFLIQRGMDVNVLTGPVQAGNSNKLSPLHLCVHAKVFHVLLKFGANLTQRDVTNTTPIDYMIQSQEPALLTAIYQSAVFVEQAVREKLLFSATGMGNIDLLRDLIEKEHMNINSLVENGKNALHAAVETQQTHAAAFLIAHNILVDQPDCFGNTPLHMMAIKNQPIMMQFLISHEQVNPNVKNNDGQTALYCACFNGHLECVQYLLLLGAKPDIAANNGYTPAQIAWKKGHKNIAQFLLICGDFSLFETSFDSIVHFDSTAESQRLRQNLSMVSQQNENELHLAVRCKHLDAIRFIYDIAKHTNQNLHQKSNSLGQTPLMLAEALGDRETAALLSYYIGRDLSPCLPMYPYQAENTIRVYSASELTEVLQQPEDSFIMNETNIMLGALLSQLAIPTQNACMLHYNNLNAPAKSVFRETLTLFLQDLLEVDDTLLKEVDYCILSRYSWTALFETTAWIDLIKEIMSINSPVLRQWFLSVVKPMTQTPLLQDRWHKMINEFSAFSSVYRRSPHAHHLLSLPPGFPISFQVNSDYLQRVNLALSLFENEAQWAMLNDLPSSRVLQQAANVGLPFICQAMIHEEKLLPMMQELPSSACYSYFKPATLTWIAKHHPEDFSGFVHLFMALQPLSERFTNSHKLIVCRFVLQSVAFGWPQDMVNDLVSISQQIQLHFGDGLFRLIFEQKETQRRTLSDYIDILQQMCHLVEQDETNALMLANSLRQSGVHTLFETIQLHFVGLLSQQMQHENINALRERFATPSPTLKVPLSDAILEPLIQGYQRILFYCDAFKSHGKTQLRKTIQQMAKTAKTDAEASYQLLAATRLLVFHTHHLYPYDTQIFSLLMMINYPTHHRGCIAQILTGQGKSMIIAMLSMYYAVQGRNVDVITSSRNLSGRDEKKYASFFEAGGTTSSAVIVAQPTAKDFRGKIIYSTTFDLECVILREMYEENKARYVGGVKREPNVIIVDEADNIIIDSVFNTTRIADEPVLDTRWVYFPLYQFVKEKILHETPPISTTTGKIRELLSQYQGGSHIDQVALFSEKLLKTWFNNATKAYYSVLNKDYVIEPVDASMVSSPLKITIMQRGQTGRRSENSRWGGGLHEFLEVKHGLDPQLEQLSAASIAHPSFLSEYQTIFALTGTLGTEKEAQEMQTLNNICAYYCPPHHPLIRRDEPLRYFLEEASLHDAILERVSEMMMQNRPVLLLCEDIVASKEWVTRLKQHHQNIKVQCLNDVQFFHEDYIIEQAGRPSVVTVATHVAGRGTDIILLKESLEANGLHVIITFLPENSRVENQGKGRAGRQGQPGSCELMIHAEDSTLQQIIPSQPTRQQLVNGDFSLIDRERERHIDQLSDLRLQHATYEVSIFRYEKQFYENSFHQLRGLIGTLPKAILLKHCVTFNPERAIEIPQNIAVNRLTQGAYKCLSVMLREQQNGRVVNWESVILICKKTFLNYLRQQWAIVYSSFDDRLGGKISEDEMHIQYNQLIQQYIEPVRRNPMQTFLQFMDQLLALGLRYNLQQGVEASTQESRPDTRTFVQQSMFSTPLDRNNNAPDIHNQSPTQAITC